LAFLHNAAGGEARVAVELNVLPLGTGEGLEASQPAGFGIAAVYPNPFNSLATIRFELSRTTYHHLKVYDLNGREVVVLFEGWGKSGRHSLAFNSTRLPSGIYIIRLVTPEAVDSRKVALVK